MTGIREVTGIEEQPLWLVPGSARPDPGLQAPFVILPSDTAVLTSVERTRVGRNVAALAGGQAITWIVALAWAMVVPRLLGPGQMGILVTAWSVSGVMGVFMGLGTKDFLVREMVARAHESASIVGTAVTLRLCFVPLFAVAVIVYDRTAHLNGEASLVLWLATAATGLMLVAEPWQAAFQASQRMHYLALSDVVNKSVQGVAGITLAVLGLGAAGLTSCWLAVAALVIVLDAYWLSRYTRIEFRHSIAKMGRLFRASLPYYAFGTAYMVYLWIDSAMLAFLTPAKVVAWYGVPTKLFTTLMFVPVIIATAWLPQLVKAFGRGRTALYKAAREPIELVLVIGLPICVASVMLSHPVIDVLYGSRYAPAAPVMEILALCVLPMYLSIILNQVLVAANRPMVWTWILIVAAVVNPTVNWFLIRFFQHHAGNGAIGAALSLLLTELMVVVLGVIVLGRRIIDSSSLKRLSRAVVAAMGMGGLMYLSSPVGFVPEAILGWIGFIALALLLRVMSLGEVLDSLRKIRVRASAALRGRWRRTPAHEAQR